jgi:uncharacterized pyridoxal phosphate-containing UPF0001 family protein
MNAGPGGVDVQGALAAVRERIASLGRSPDELTIVAVTKGHSADAVLAAMRAGLGDVGENYSQELLDKHATLSQGRVSEAGVSEGGALPGSETEGAPLRWHFLGAVQRNKVPKMAALVDTWQAVDRPEEAAAIRRWAPSARLLVQVQLAGGPRRAGCQPAGTAALVEELDRLGCRPVGLMAVGAMGDPRATREGFAWLASEARRLGLDEVSMGMSDDYELAVELGATMLRLGTVLFGPRRGSVSPVR